MSIIDFSTAEIDFEYYDSNEMHPTLVCGSIMFNGDANTAEEFWLLKDYEEHSRMASRILELKESDVMIAHAATAESRCYLALGVDPCNFRWIDTFLERRQLTNKCERYSYGVYYDKNGNRRESAPPSFHAWKNQGVDNRKLNCGYAVSVGRHLDICVDTEHKDEMRRIILSRDDELINANREHIQAYCTSDVVHLRPLAEQMFQDLHKVTDRVLTTKNIVNAALRRGRFAADTAKMESIGMPLDLDKLKCLQDNYDLAKDELIEDLVVNHYPFFVREKDTKFKNHLLGTWKFKTTQIVQFIEDRGLDKGWPKTEPNSRSPFGSYKTDKDTLSLYGHIPEIAALAEVNKQIGQLKWFRPLSKKEIMDDGQFMDAVGSDGMLRPFFGPLGTQTGRNAPPAKKFILAMSSWLRCLIRPPKGEVVVACDWASQESAVAAILGGDQAMADSYESGDPYLHFAKLAGAVPMGADPKICKDPALVWKQVQDFPQRFEVYHMSKTDEDELNDMYPEIMAEYTAYRSHKKQRGLFKSCTLGQQYGMSANGLYVFINNTGTEISLKETERLVKQHKKIYRTFWKWADSIGSKYKGDKCLTLWDGWTLLGDNDNGLSVKNFPVQGTAATIMRLAVQKATDAGVNIMCPLHDALYARCKVGQEDEVVAKLHSAMDSAVVDVLGDSLRIRIDTDIHGHDDVWIEEKGEANYERLKKFLEPQEDSMVARSKITEQFFNALRGR